MNLELEYQLVKDFPWMKPGDSVETYEPYDAYGCECADGWYEVIRGFCTDVTNLYKEKGLPVGITVMQIKEKFGLIRIYVNVDDPEMYPVVNKIISKWEEVSARTCELCGADGTIRKKNGWLQTSCDKCSDEQDQHIKEINRKREEELTKIRAEKEEQNEG